MYFILKKYNTMDIKLTELSIVDARKLLLNREITSIELVSAHLENAKNDSLNCFITLTSELAMKQAKRSDERIKNGTAGIIEGIPVGVKDLFCTEGIQTTAGSKMLHGFIPQYESTVTSLLYANGGVCIGKTNMDEFAMGSSNMTSHYGNVINPWKSISEPNENLVPGGSSGGSAAAVASRTCMASLGSDTGGSIRQPAAFCGLVGIKPTYGRCSRWGMVAFASSLDQAGAFARSVEDVTLVLQAICGYDAKDSTSANISVPDWQNLIQHDVKGMRVGIPKEYEVNGMSADIIQSWQNGKEWLKAQGAEILEISLPHTSYALPVYYTIAPAEASANLARYDGVRYGFRQKADTMYDMISESRTKGFGREVKRRLLIGKFVLSSFSYDEYYLQAQKVRRLIHDDFINAFQSVDVILTPTTPSAAFPMNNIPKDPIQMYLNDLLTIPASLAGLPTISVPAGLSNGLPLGLQLIGKHFDETSILNAAFAIERAANFQPL